MITLLGPKDGARREAGRQGNGAVSKDPQSAATNERRASVELRAKGADTVIKGIDEVSTLKDSGYGEDNYLLHLRDS